jgi:toxin-antitoxin system PIN domain toxin
MSRVALLDVNVLVALFDPNHVHHEAAHEWFGAHRRLGWATCPLTENGLMRVLSSPAYPGATERPVQILERLQAFCASGRHVFWTDAVSFRDAEPFRLDLGFSHRKITDAYLLGLAKRNAGRLATFDRNIPLAWVLDATEEHLVVLPL